jgi:hypothetical protein
MNLNVIPFPNPILPLDTTTASWTPQRNHPVEIDQETQNKFYIGLMPDIQFFISGQEVARISGAITEAEFDAAKAIVATLKPQTKKPKEK